MQTDTMDRARSAPTPESVILSELASAPAAPAELKLRVQDRVGKITAAAWKTALGRLETEQLIHGLKRAGKNGKPTKIVERYKLGAPPPPPPPPPPPQELAREMILTLLQGGTPSAPDLKKRVRANVSGLPAKTYDAVIEDLVLAKKIFARRARDAKGKPKRTVERYTLGGPPPAEFLGPVTKAWEQAKIEAKSAGLTEHELAAALLSALELSVPTPPVAAASERELVLGGLRELVAREGSGALIAIRKLRAAVPLAKERFDAVLLELSGEDAIILHHHDYVASLSAEEREMLVVDKYGNNYVGVALRGGT